MGTAAMKRSVQHARRLLHTAIVPLENGALTR